MFRVVFFKFIFYFTLNIFEECSIAKYFFQLQMTLCLVYNIFVHVFIGNMHTLTIPCMAHGRTSRYWILLVFSTSYIQLFFLNFYLPIYSIIMLLTRGYSLQHMCAYRNWQYLYDCFFFVLHTPYRRKDKTP